MYYFRRKLTPALSLPVPFLPTAHPLSSGLPPPAFSVPHVPPQAVHLPWQGLSKSLGAGKVYDTGSGSRNIDLYTDW